MCPFNIDGIVPVVPTPFGVDGQPDWEALRNLLEFAKQAKVCAVCLPAYASEFYKLSESERRELPCRAISILRGRLPVIAQVNYVSAAQAAETARSHEQCGAAAISVAVPRLFGLPESDLLRYFDRVLSAINIPLLIQDYNPGGTTLSPAFVKSLHVQHPHFRYLKLEEPLMSARVQSIVEVTSGAVGVIEGWGGMYMLELIDAGICGVMPGLAVSDVLQMVWERARTGDKDSAYSALLGVLPQITYSLQSVEFFHHAEKALLVARGVIANSSVRDATLTLHENDKLHIEFLNRKTIDFVRTLKIGRTPTESRD